MRTITAGVLFDSRYVDGGGFQITPFGAPGPRALASAYPIMSTRTARTKLSGAELKSDARFPICKRFVSTSTGAAFERRAGSFPEFRPSAALVAFPSGINPGDSPPWRFRICVRVRSEGMFPIGRRNPYFARNAVKRPALLSIANVLSWFNTATWVSNCALPGRCRGFPYYDDAKKKTIKRKWRAKKEDKKGHVAQTRAIGAISK